MDTGSQTPVCFPGHSHQDLLKPYSTQANIHGLGLLDAYRKYSEKPKAQAKSFYRGISRGILKANMAIQACRLKY